MDNRKLIAYAVDADTGKVTWCLYDEPWKYGNKNKCNERCYVETAMNSEV